MRGGLFSAVVALVLAGCSEVPDEKSQPGGNVLELDVEGLSFVGADTVNSGWTTVRINNDGGMTHFGLVYRLPEGVDAEMIDELGRQFQASLTARIEGDEEEANRILANLPEWVGDLVWLGGPGLIGDGVVGEATMYLEPGNYIVECYVKTNGQQHNFNPELGQFGMIHPFTVLDEDGGMVEPAANVTLALSNDGFRIVDGEFRPGENSVRAEFAEQTAYNGLIGHDAHVFRIDEDTDVTRAASWPNFFPVDGQSTPAPAHFVGGIHDMPEGSTGYFKLNLDPGEYGITAEIPDAMENGFFKRFEVQER